MRKFEQYTFEQLLRGVFAQVLGEPMEAVLDGDLHTTDRDCCHIMGGACPRCGGFRHGQPVYGGIAYLCEGCPEDVTAWYPRGSHAPRPDGLGWRDGPLW